MASISSPERPGRGAHRFGCHRAVALLVAFAASLPASATSVLEAFSGNGGVITTNLTLGFSGGPTSSLTAHGPFYTGAIIDPAAGPLIVQAPGTFTETPFTGSTKDIATITPTTKFSYGAPFGSGEDQLTFEFDATLSAENAFDAGGNALDAEVHYKAEFGFFLDPIGVPAGTFVGEMRFDSLRQLADYESLKNLDNGVTLAAGAVVVSSAAGDMSAPVPVPAVQLFTDRLYTINYSFDAVVPHGIDPHYGDIFGTHLAYGFTQIPLPASAVLLLPALAVLRRRRSEAAARRY